MPSQNMGVYSILAKNSQGVQIVFGQNMGTDKNSQVVQIMPSQNMSIDKNSQGVQIMFGQNMGIDYWGVKFAWGTKYRYLI